MFNWFLENVTLPYVLVFAGGLLFGYFINWYKYARQDKPMKRRDGFVTVVGLIVVIAMAWIMISVGQARECALRLNNSVSTEQAIAKIERDALTQVFFEAANPPDAIAALPQDDPARKAWGKQLGTEYFTKVQEAARERDANKAVQDAARKACGPS